ncbi:TetR family transcriptional regulator [Saccharomonospora viridis]|uniref:TetR family transcriptional regulator n=2 Tax=Saccharomonospora viridis TaxID=1852 RepID=A0A837D9M8_9PSEU|nr:TetR family transcriptional regulator [Saccharomonospora viridis]
MLRVVVVCKHRSGRAGWGRRGSRRRSSAPATAAYSKAMTSTGLEWRHYGPSPLPPVLASALDRFAEQGYHGTSTRELAAGAGLSVPGLYHHYRSKQDILMALMVAVMEELLARTEAALASAGDSPVERFDALVESMLRFHMFRQREAFVASSEIRSLEPANRKRYVALRDRQQRMIDEVVVAGARDGYFATPYPADAARGIATLCIGVASWFRMDGPLSVDQVLERQLVLARDLVAARS